MSEGKPHVHFVYLPAELYVGIAGVQYKYNIGKSASILLMITKGLYTEGLISQETYEKFKERYQKELTKIVKRESSEVKTEPILKEKPKKAYVDYSKLSDDELLERYRKAIVSNDVVKPQLIQHEANKRGYRFKADDNGNIQIISLRGVSP